MARNSHTALTESSDDEGEPSVNTVSDYRFEDENDLPVSFSVLPLIAVGNNTPREISLYGKVDNGLRKMSKQVVAWNYDLSASVSSASISVLSKDGKWIVLGGKPIKWYGNGEARTILVTLAALHFIRRIPKVSHKALWDHLAKSFSSFDVKPNPSDLINHIDLIADAVKSDSFLGKSELLRSFLEDPEKIANHVVPKVASKFVVDDRVDYSYERDSDENEDSEEAELYDSVCAFCDNGGFVLCCEGVCMRAFHAAKEAESQCEGVGLSKREVDAIQTFVCKNCKYKVHQCFCCGKLGVSDKSKCPEVFRCSNAYCGHFYHPQCIAELLKPEDKSGQEQLKKGISEGESFICTIHKCAVCAEGEKKKEIDLQFAVCRRCPTAYHRKCLPREIRFAKSEEEQNDEESDEEEDNGIVDRAWENLLPNRVLIYCLNHEIIEGLGTPARGHVLFPEVPNSKGKNVLERPRRTATLVKKTYNEDTLQRKRSRVSEKPPSPLKKSKVSESQSSSGSLKKQVEVDKTPLRRAKSLPPKTRKSSSSSINTHNKSTDHCTRKRKSEHIAKSHDSDDSTSPDNIPESLNPLTEESKRRVLSLMRKSEFEVTLDDAFTKRQIPSVYAHSSKNMIDKIVTLGKVEGAVEAVRAAVNKLKNGSTADEAKAVCGPEVLNQIFKWQSKLKVYLAPVLHGSRYTSYGRHFTKVEKLEEIASILHPYVRSGDMIVDFCCGANDFSCIMQKKLEESGKKCLYKNYDIIQPKNSFNFEMRDWMTVEPHDLIDGGKLIIGLNPPFGVKGALANKFINKALHFKPKLLILIVPHETERPNLKNPPYDVVWENNAVCSGKSFYLPGSDTQLDQWNANTPSLVLWSRRDWTSKHTSIAKIHSHSQENVNGSDNNEMDVDVINVDDEDVFVEKTTDVAPNDSKIAPPDSGVPRGSPSSRRDVGVVKVEGDDRAPPPLPPLPHRVMPRGMSAEKYSRNPPRFGHGASYEHGLWPTGPRPYAPTVNWSEREAGFRQRFGSFQQNAATTSVPAPTPYPGVVPDPAPGFEYRRRMSAIERYAPQLNDLSYTVGVGRFGPARRGRGLHFRQPHDQESIPYPNPSRPFGNPSTWHNPILPNN